MLTSLLATVVVLSVLILVHEFGHFFAARSVNIQVPRFSLGLGARVWGFRWGETEFVVSAIPLGGYVKMAGMDDDEAQSTLEGGAEGEPVDPERTFDAKPLWARAWVISAGVIMNFLFAFVAFAVYAMAFGEADYADTRVVTPGAETTAPGAREAAKIPSGVAVAAVGDSTVTTFNGVRRALLAAPAGPLPVRMADGSTITLQVPADEEQRAALIGSVAPFIPALLGEVTPDGPLDKAGLRAGDRILSIDGAPTPAWTEVTRVVQANPEKRLAFVAVRGADTVRTVVTTTRDESQKPAIGRMGGALDPDVVEPLRNRMGPVDAVVFGARATWETTAMIATTLKQLVTGELSPSNLGGLLTIGEASGESARAGPDVFLSFLALFSVNLAVLNLLPIPILDGGHLLFLGIEALRGRPLSVETRIRLSHVGLIVVIGLMLWANGNDVVRWVGRLFGG